MISVLQVQSIVPWAILKSWCSKRQKAVDAGEGRRAALGEADAIAEFQGPACELVNGALQVAGVTQNEPL